MRTVTTTTYEYDTAGRLKQTVAVEEIIFPEDGPDHDREDPVLRRYSPDHPVFHRRIVEPENGDVVNLDDYR
jgi:hypothetical protein